MKIAIINRELADALLRTVIDGLIGIKNENQDLSFFLSDNFGYEFSEQLPVLRGKDFIDHARQADLIILGASTLGPDIELAEKINAWNRTIFVDSMEPGRNRRLDYEEQYSVLRLKKHRGGTIDKKLLKKCALYFRREKPYLYGIKPLPFGIESVYHKDFDIKQKKDIDFFCVFGQDKFPLMRHYAVKILEKFCKKNKFKCHTKKVPRAEFYRLLNRSKAGISIGGGGFDTMRFWEILANNCLLLTERIDIYHPNSRRLDYGRIHQFNNLHDFAYQLEKVGKFLRDGYRQEDLSAEYRRIIDEQSSKARAYELLKIAAGKGILRSADV